MIFECNASRLAIHISLGHRNSNFFLKNHKKYDLLASGLTDFFKKMSKIRKENLSLSRQEVTEIMLVGFLDVGFATRVLQNDMFCQALGTEKDFRDCLDPNNLGERKNIYISIERERERERER